MKEALSVLWDEKRVGRLTMDEHGDTGFTYDATWLANSSGRSISRSLPKREEPFDRRQTRPFFAGLSPDETVREVVARVHGVSERNDFSLLNALGGDIADALTILPDDEIPVAYNGATATTPQTDDELAQLIEVLPKRPFLAHQDACTDCTRRISAKRSEPHQNANMHPRADLLSKPVLPYCGKQPADQLR